MQLTPAAPVFKTPPYFRNNAGVPAVTASVPNNLRRISRLRSSPGPSPDAKSLAPSAIAKIQSGARSCFRGFPRSLRYLATAPSPRFRMLSATTSTPKTNWAPVSFYFIRSPPFPHATSMNVPPPPPLFPNVWKMIRRFTNALWKSLIFFVRNWSRRIFRF